LVHRCANHTGARFMSCAIHSMDEEFVSTQWRQLTV
jgi:hypothetical protein